MQYLPKFCYILVILTSFFHLTYAEIQNCTQECDEHAICIISAGKQGCMCKKGYRKTADMLHCLPECNCWEHSKCVIQNEVQSCECISGYTLAANQKECLPQKVPELKEEVLKQKEASEEKVTLNSSNTIIIVAGVFFTIVLGYLVISTLVICLRNKKSQQNGVDLKIIINSKVNS